MVSANSDTTGPIWETGLWRDTERIPESLAATLRGRDGFGEVAALLTRPGTRRVIVSGSGASYYVALAMWLASLHTGDPLSEVVPVPSGLLARDAFKWQRGDVLLAVSSSGEARDLIEATESKFLPRPFAAITANPGGSVSRGADATAVTAVVQQAAITHTQAFCAAVAASLGILAIATRDQELDRALDHLPGACQRSIDMTRQWAAGALATITTPPATMVFGTGPAWAGALEGALLLKEVARIPSEGSETREGATTAMTGLLPNHLAVSLAFTGDPLAEEAELVCRSIPCQLLRVPSEEGVDRRLAAVSTFAPLVALAIDLALRAGWDADNPEWYSRYERTARRG
jgi:fructoselysine-6-P-deglycase FrlB-like protein